MTLRPSLIIPPNLEHTESHAYPAGPPLGVLRSPPRRRSTNTPKHDPGANWTPAVTCHTHVTDPAPKLRLFVGRWQVRAVCPMSSSVWYHMDLLMAGAHGRQLRDGTWRERITSFQVVENYIAPMQLTIFQLQAIYPPPPPLLSSSLF